jgi:methyl acetate hydrolase
MHDMDRRSFLASGSMIAAGTTLASSTLQPVTALAQPLRGNFAAIDAALDAAVSNGAVLGVAAIAATRDGIVYDGASGKANVETGAPLRDDTVFWLLSMTKAFTVTAAMQLMEQGRMRLDQPAAEILPELAAPKILEGFDIGGQPVLRPAKLPITVRHLLTHTSSGATRSPATSR